LSLSPIAGIPMITMQLLTCQLKGVEHEALRGGERPGDAGVAGRLRRGRISRDARLRRQPLRVLQPGKASRSFTSHLNLSRFGHRTPPVMGTFLSGGAPPPCIPSNGRLPLLEWAPRMGT
jgi:hypothetical protein